MLKLEHVTKYYGDFKAVDDLSFTVKPGEIFGLLGVNGAGKTTTFRMIIGLLDSTEGTITLDGKKIDYDVTDKIGFLTEERSLLTKFTVKEQCIFYGRLKGMSEDEIEKKLDYLLERFGVPSYKNKKIKELSKGNQQKIQFITAVLNDPKLLILDEPFAGLDPLNVELFKEYIVELSNKGSIIIFSSHRMEHVELFCKKLVVLKDGKPVISGYLKDIKEKFRKKNIIISGDVDIEKIKNINGVISVEENPLDINVKIEDEMVAPLVFKEISKMKNITKYALEEPSLNEIFVAKVGESYEK